MQFILKLLKEVLNRLSNIYKKEFVDELLSTKVSVEESEEVIADLAEVRELEDGIIQENIDSSKAYDEALSNVIKWQSYAAAMQSMVDDETAIQIAEEFEKAAEEYLKDPTVSKRWEVKKESDGIYSSTSPYSEESDTKVLVDFSSIWANGYYSDATKNKGLFSLPSCKVIFFPNATLINNAFLYKSGSFNGVIFLPGLTNAYRLFQGSDANPFIFAPDLTEASQLCRNLTKFNNKLYLPNANICNYMLQTDTSFNQPLDLPSAKECAYMLGGCSKFNHSLSLKNATFCDYMLGSAKSFNSTLDLPVVVRANYMLKGATSFNQPVNFPELLYAMELLNGATSFNQAAILPKCSSLKGAFTNTAMSAENITATLNSLRKWTDGASRAITFSGCPGIASVATTESFTATDDDGVEYTMENCPIFINDDDNQSLRKSVALAVIKKGWTVEQDITYTQAEYLEFTGTQYIDTGIVGNLDTSYEIVFDTDVVLSDHMVLFGSRESASSRSISTMVHTASRSILTDFGDYTNTRQAYTAFKPTTLYKVYNSKNNRSVYDYETNLTTSVATSYTSSFTTPTNLFIGYKSSGFTAEMTNFSGRVFGCKIWQAGVLVRDLIPVVDNNGVASMYDKVSRATFTSSGNPFITPTIE